MQRALRKTFILFLAFLVSINLASKKNYLETKGFSFEQFLMLWLDDTYILFSTSPTSSRKKVFLLLHWQVHNRAKNISFGRSYLL